MNSTATRTVSKRRLWNSRLAWLARWLHIYASMLGLAVTLFFSVTGLTLNHPDWFQLDQPVSRQAEGNVDPAWLQGADATTVNQLAIVEHLRGEHRIAARLRSFDADEYQCSISFAGPGYTADAWLDRPSGKYQLQINELGLVAILNDLHKGRDSGPVWFWLIDVSAVLLTVISFSGLLLIVWLKRRQVRGMLCVAVGAIATWGVYVWGV